ncbi:MAG: septum formation initiator family protein [Pseudomonadota bacterium]
MARKRIFIDIIAPALCVCWGAAFIYGAFAGEASYGALTALEEERTQKASDLEALRRRREALEKRADLLNASALDPDITDERIRSVLGFSAEGDIIFPRRELRRAVGLERKSADDAQPGESR